MNFKEWFKNYLKCEWEDFEGNINDNDMQNAFEAGREYEAKLRSFDISKD